MIATSAGIEGRIIHIKEERGRLSTLRLTLMSAFHITFITPYYSISLVLLHDYQLELVLFTLYCSMRRNPGRDTIWSEIGVISSVWSDKRAHSWLTRVGHARVSSTANSSLMCKRAEILTRECLRQDTVTTRPCPKC